MAHEIIPTAILSERLGAALGGRTVKAAVFTTFSFEPDFFELEVLPILFEQSFSHVPNVRLKQLEEALLGSSPIAVYYDRAALNADAEPARLDVRRFGISRRTGCFHPKVIAVLVEDVDEKTTATSAALVIAVMSANLTRSGWWENVECVELVELGEASKCSFKSELREILKAIRKSVASPEPQEALEAIDKFVSKLDETRQRSQGGVLHPRLYGGRKGVPDFVSEELALTPGEYHLEIISPYFDASQGTQTLERLITAVQPRSTTVFLPQADDGAALVDASFFEQVAALPKVRWGRLPSEMLARSKEEDGSRASRFVHAKVYRLWSRDEAKEFILVGSVNLTDAAHSHPGAGNLEAAFLIQSPELLTARSWLKPLGAGERPQEFKIEANTDEPGEASTPPVTVTFDWATGRATYYWEATKGVKPGVAVLRCAGIDIGRIEPVQLGETLPLTEVEAALLRDRLMGTSFLQVVVDGGPEATILVSEQGMAHKPSVLRNMTAAEILTYWSLLSPEQRETFLTKKVAQVLMGKGIALPQVAPPRSLFDGFAGIFHAFKRLEEHVSLAIEKAKNSEATYRLFGKRYDSLPSLLDKVLEDLSADPVDAYVTLLSAQQLVAQLRAKDAEHAAFFLDHVNEAAELERSLARIADVRARFSFDTEAERAQFFAWFEKRFLEEATLPAEEA